ncbi:hypothetical protein [Permianibacter aggregans]|uniref:Uncharacterized protein n=1 Tax=Permianibacter aggregans TaxID=1510150 RepID=A0A4R6UVF6_9GAMM|nr:hypothetical protein [Permianibacter aggregans]QGX39450.1 hypothetical protein E2H98_07160 [Permianibacter aggregans]TDQ49813.1 hypothetical protein EV696_103185 [Permianibacter aggregans]
MSNVVSFKKAKQQRNKGQSPLCREGFHKWQVVTANQFDVKQGKLVTAYRCERCGKQKIEAR